MALENGKWAVAVAAVLVSSVASGAPLSLWMGQSELLGTQRKIAKITVSDPSVVTVVKQKSGAELRATAPGVSHVEMRTTDGFVFEFDVHVTRGAEVYSVNRAEPEHAGFTLDGYKAPAKPTSKDQARRPAKTARPAA